MLIKRGTKSGANGLLTVYRPCNIGEFKGNDELKRLMTNSLLTGGLAHTLLFTGEAGTGKTTLARILALRLNCENPNGAEACLQCNACKSQLNFSSMDVVEVNVGSNGGKSAVDNVVSELAGSPFRSKYKIIIFDECHMLTDAAKALLLKHMEDCYAHVYLMFCTNEPEKLINKKGKGGNPFIDRCSHFKVSPLTEKETYDMLINVLEFEGSMYTTDIVEFIVEYAKGIPRKALNCLDAVIKEGSWDLNSVQSLIGEIIIDDDDPEIIELSRALLGKDFRLSCDLFSSIVKKKPVESIRVAVCGYFVAVLKKNPSTRVSNALTQLTTPIYLTGKPAEHIFYNLMFKVITYMGK